MKRNEFEPGDYVTSKLSGLVYQIIDNKELCCLRVIPQKFAFPDTFRQATRKEIHEFLLETSKNCINGEKT